MAVPSPKSLDPHSQIAPFFRRILPLCFRLDCGNVTFILTTYNLQRTAGPYILPRSYRGFKPSKEVERENPVALI